MKVTRFAYQIRITQLCIGIVQVILVILLGSLLVVAPYFFSPYSPRNFIQRECTIVELIPGIQKSPAGSTDFYMWKVLNVSFTENGHTSYGNIEYCKFVGVESTILDLVALCEKATPLKKSEIIFALEPYYLNGKYYYEQKERTLYLSNDVLSEYNFEVFFGLSLGAVYLVFSIIFEVVSISFVEIKWRKYFTLIRNKQLPKPKKFSSNEEQESFIIKKANLEQFGRMTMKRGCLICPKLEDKDKIVRTYHLSNNTSKRNGRNELPLSLRERGGYWKVLSATSRYEKEKIMYHYKMPVKKSFFSPRGCITILSIPLTMLVIVGILIGVLYLFLYMQGPYMMLSAVLVIISIMCLYIIGAVFEFLGGIVQLASEQVIVTDSRIVFLWIERFNHKIEFLFYNDIDEIDMADGTNVINCKVSERLLTQLMLVDPDVEREDGRRRMPQNNPISGYLKYLSIEDAKGVVDLVKDLKEKFKNFKMDDDDDDDDDDDEELKDVRVEEVNEREQQNAQLNLNLEDEKYSKLNEEPEEEEVKEQEVESKV